MFMLREVSFDMYVHHQNLDCGAQVATAQIVDVVCHERELWLYDSFKDQKWSRKLVYISIYVRVPSCGGQILYSEMMILAMSLNGWI